MTKQIECNAFFEKSVDVIHKISKMRLRFDGKVKETRTIDRLKVMSGAACRKSVVVKTTEKNVDTASCVRRMRASLNEGLMPKSREFEVTTLRN